MKRSEYFALRITHFLKGYRKKKNLTQTEMAKLLETSKSTVSRLEKNDEKQVLHTLVLMENFGKLEGMSLGEFLSYLDLKEQKTDSGSTLFPWQKILLNRFLTMKQSIRLDVVTELMPQDAKKLEFLFSFLVAFNRLSESKQKAFENLLREF
jgi:transcriptional regulator with XRE-family HTH domain